jgi:hypothetical protein
MADVVFTVTVPGGTGGGYYINGIQKPIVPVVTGGTFRFNQNDASNATHPLALSTTTSTAGRITTGVVYYLDGITTQADYYNTSLFNASTVRYIEITVSQTTDFFYICNVHGGGMGNSMDVTFNTWSALNWGNGGWNEQNNSELDLTGLQISTEEGDVYSGQLGGWGQFTWGFGEWGDQINPNVDVTGLQLNTSIGNENAFTNASVNLSTNLISSTTNTVILTAGTLVEPTFVLANTSVANVFAGENVIIEVTTPGTDTTWGINSWGSGAWNKIAGVDSQIGDESIIATAGAVLSGVQSNTTTGTFTITGTAILNLSTNLLNTTTGNANVVGGVFVELTAPGNLPWGATAWGNGSWGNIGGMSISQGAEEEAVPSVAVNLSGNALIFTLTSIAQITGNANVTLNTNILSVNLGNSNVIPNTVVSLSTNLLNVSTSGASGQSLTIVSPTGVNSTASTGRLFISAWAVVDIGVTNNWSVVDIAA